MNIYHHTAYCIFIDYFKFEIFIFEKLKLLDNFIQFIKKTHKIQCYLKIPYMKF